MKTSRHSSGLGHILAIIALVASTIGTSNFAGAADKLTEEQKIEGLLGAIETSDAVFVRNGKDYPAKEAVQHLRSKLDSASHMLFAPKRSEWTAKMFIEKIASKSSLSGREYFVRLPNQRLYPASQFLNEQLQILEAAQ